MENRKWDVEKESKKKANEEKNKLTDSFSSIFRPKFKNIVIYRGSIRTKFHRRENMKYNHHSCKSLNY